MRSISARRLARLVSRSLPIPLRGDARAELLEHPREVLAAFKPAFKGDVSDWQRCLAQFTSREIDPQAVEEAHWGNCDGASLAVEFGFGAAASLDANPFDLRRQFARHDLEITSWCAHANLLDPAAPWRFGNAQIIKAIRAAALIGLKHVVTTEGEPSSEFGHALTKDEQLFSIREKLFEPLRLAEDAGVKLLIEPHGPVSDDVKQLERLLDACDSPAIGLNLDTGNLWLGGGDPVEFIEKFGSKIEHVHWTDMPAEMEAQRGRCYGCGTATIALGEGVVDIPGVVKALQKANFSGHTTLEVAGEQAVLASRDFLRSLWAIVR